MSYFLYVFVVLAGVWQYSQAEDFYSFTVHDHNGEEVSLERYRGKVTLVVNVATLCGYTDNMYKELKKLHDILSYGDHFSVLAFPCNQFGDQEPHNIDEIVEHVTSNYDVEFPIFNKISVFGEHADPAFKFLTDTSSVIPDWNFYKYLVDGSGEVLGAWGTRTAIQDIFDDVQAAVKKAQAASEGKKKEGAEAKRGEDKENADSDTDASKDEL